MKSTESFKMRDIQHTKKGERPSQRKIRKALEELVTYLRHHFLEGLANLSLGGPLSFLGVLDIPHLEFDHTGSRVIFWERHISSILGMNTSHLLI
jgi:hypothetical protein